MKIKTLFIAFLAVSTIFVACKKDNAPIPVNVTLNSGTASGIWKKGGTYTINGSLIIPKDSSLTIEEGVTVLFADTSKRSEIIVKGNIYSKGTASNPVKFTVPDQYKTSANAMQGLWGGIVASPTCQEILFLYTTIEYAGAVTTSNSLSVINGLYKAAAGEKTPALYASNVDGKVVVMNCKIQNIKEDVFYMEGGKIIFANNVFASSGLENGGVINLKSGCTADCAYNLIFSSNSDGFKLSNSGDKIPQTHAVCYNNTLVNCGWRRPDIKGGSVWMEKLVFAELYNNILANCRWGVKFSKADTKTIYDYTYYYGYTQQCVNQFTPNTTWAEVVRGTHDIAGTTAGANDPKFVNYPLSNDGMNYAFDNSWDFHLQAGSPALTGAKTDVIRNFPSGLTIGGITYTAPAASAFYGAFGAK
ncbi:MAG: right-handed parallel beta-helix repeat-containing protein [Bacteroidetes bacterium]|nr:right-handed parallel beta-helix repeat-containing protein [Bacteroidota bacterium]